LSRDEIVVLGAEVYESDRGGSVTYHGPGQLVAYPIVDLRRGGLSPVEYVRGLEETMLRSVRSFGVVAQRRPGLPGLWCVGGKIGAIGVRVRHGITMHGFSLNVSSDLRWFDCILACGLDAPATSIERQVGQAPEMAQVFESVARHFAAVLGYTQLVRSQPSLTGTRERQ
jgi:lipoyl(octanoyl) transferase